MKKVDGLDVVFKKLVDGTHGNYIYKQQIGCAFSSFPTKFSLIFDIINNFENLYSIGFIEKEIRAAMTYYNFFGDGEFVTDKFQLFDEVEDCRRPFGDLEVALSASWRRCMRLF